MTTTDPAVPAEPSATASADPPDQDPLVPANLDGWALAVAGVVRRSWPRLVPLQLVVAVATLVFMPSLTRALQPLMGGVVPDAAGLAGFAEAGFGTPPRPPELPSPSLVVSVLVISLLAGLLSVLTFAAGVRVVVVDAAGRTESLVTSLRFALSRMFPLVGWLIVGYLLLVVALLALVLPVLYVGVVLGATLAGVVVVERGNIARCFTLVNRELFATAGRLLLLVVVLTVYAMLSGVVAWAFGGALSATSVILSAALQVPAGLVTLGAVVVAYAELRHRENPGVSTQTLADELDRPCSPRGRKAAAALLVVVGLLAVVVPDQLAASAGDRPPVAEPKPSGQVLKVRDQPRSIALSPNGLFGYVVHDAGKLPGTLSVIDLAKGSQVGRVPAEVAAVPVGVDPRQVVATADGKRVYVANGGGSAPDGSVSVYDIASGAVVQTIAVAGNPAGLAVTPDGRKVYVASADTRLRGRVAVIDTMSNQAAAILPVGDNPSSLAISPDGRRVYVAAFGTNIEPGGTVTVIDTATDTQVSTLTVARAPKWLAVTPDGARLYIAHGTVDQVPGSTVTVVDLGGGSPPVTVPVGVNPIEVRFTPDGRYAYVVNDGIKDAWGNSVTVIDTSDDRPVATVLVGTYPAAAAITPDGRTAYVANYGSDNVSIIDTGITR